MYYRVEFFDVYNYYNLRHVEIRVLTCTFFKYKDICVYVDCCFASTYINSVANLYKTIDRIARSNVRSAKNMRPIELGWNE